MRKHLGKMTVEVNVANLIAVLKINRKQHCDQVELAQQGFKREAEAMLLKHLEEVRNGRINSLFCRLEGVEDHSRDYDRVIGMLEMHQASTIELEADDYARYVEDDWDWKEAWAFSAKMYGLKA